MMRGVARAGLICGMIALAGCSSGPKPPPETIVAGTVQVDGKPLDDGDITFVLEGQPPKVLPVKDGKFEGKATVGENSVQIRGYKKGEPIMMDGKPFGDPVKVNYVAEQYNDKSELKSKIASGGQKDLKFEVASKKE